MLLLRDDVRMLSESEGLRNPHGVVVVGMIGDQPVVVLTGIMGNRWFEDREAHRAPSASMDVRGWSPLTTNGHEHLL